MPEHGSSSAPTASPTRIIALLNQKGGVGKTTTTVNLAAALAAGGKRTLIVDLDPQAHASLSLGVDPEGVSRSVYDLLLDWDDDAESAVVKARPNLGVIASETDLAAAEAELAGEQDRHLRLSRALSALAPKFDFILIDCPPSLGMLTINGLSAASEVLIPMQAHYLALQGVSKLLETVTLVRGKLNPKLRVAGVVVCMHDPSSTHTQEVVADIEGFFEQARGKGMAWSDAEVFKPAVRRNIKLAECPSFGQTIFDYAPMAPGAVDYRALALAIFGVTVPPPPPPPAPQVKPEIVKPKVEPVAPPVVVAQPVKAPVPKAPVAEPVKVLKQVKAPAVVVSKRTPVAAKPAPEKVG